MAGETSKNTGLVSSVFCDKLTINIDYQQPGEQQILLANIKEFLGLNLHAKSYPNKQYRFGIFIYEGEYPSKMQMLVEVGPKASGVSFFRIDFNPSHCDMECVAAFLQSVLPGGLQDVALKGKVSRIDLTVDFTGIHIDDLLVAYPGMQVSRGYYKSGSTETLYMGGYECAKVVVLYDKAQQVRHLNAKKHLKLAIPSEPTTRLEIRLHPDLGLAGLQALGNPFLKLILAAAASVTIHPEQVWKLFMAVAKVRGAHDALLMIDDKYQRKVFRDRLGCGTPAWWTPEKLWNTWPGLLRELFFINPATPVLLQSKTPL